MTLPNLGHAVIINNVAGELPGSMKNVEALKTTYEKVGFQVHVHTNCSVQVREGLLDTSIYCKQRSIKYNFALLHENERI